MTEDRAGIPELLPCPFCGAAAQLLKSGEGNSWIVCGGERCAVIPETIAASVDEAVSHWNLRASFGASPAPTAGSREGLAALLREYAGDTDVPAEYDIFKAQADFLVSHGVTLGATPPLTDEQCAQKYLSQRELTEAEKNHALTLGPTPRREPSPEAIEAAIRECAGRYTELSVTLVTAMLHAAYAVDAGPTPEGAGAPENGPGVLEVGTDGAGNVVVNLPRDMTGHVIFSGSQARDFASVLLVKSQMAEYEPGSLHQGPRKDA